MGASDGGEGVSEYHLENLGSMMPKRARPADDFIVQIGSVGT